MVDELQRSQATLIQASKLAALGEVTALMAHEVRTPLGILRSSAQMLRTEPQLSAEGGELVRIIESETERLNRLVSSMLDSARTRAPRRQRDDLHSIIRHALSLLAAQIRDHAISVDLALKARDAFAECDSEQITQLILNLVMNALQVLPRHGHIQIITRDGLGRIVVEVADDGPGIPVEERTRIFEPFVFKREGGVGLGLAVVKQIVRQHGGDIVADASPLGGALLRFWLPRTIDT
jgi:signal transduction histidine kinase